MRRREFIAGVSSSLGLAAARAQTGAPMPRLAVLTRGTRSADALAGLRAALEVLGWREGQNIRIDIRPSSEAAGPAEVDAVASELVSLKPDVILAHTTPVVAALRKQTTTIPIVFVSVNDPVGSGFAASLAHPGGNVTGFANYEPAVLGKMTELLKEIFPRLGRLSVMYNVNVAGASSWREPMAAAARAYSIELANAPVRDEDEIENTIASIGKDPTGGLLILADPFLGLRADLIVSSVARHKVPTIYPFRFFVDAGGLVCYGNNLVEQWRQAASYIDRILKGANPADLPVQLPTKFDFAINLRTANALGVTIPHSLLISADEVIE